MNEKLTKDTLDPQGLLGDGAVDRIVESVLSVVPADAIYLFGSYARGEENGDSDIDILVVADDDSFRTTGLIRYGLMWLKKSKDVLLCTKEYFDGHVSKFGNFLNGISCDLVKIYG